MLSNPASYSRPVGAKIWLDETRLVKALDGLTWLRYYEQARAEEVSLVASCTFRQVGSLAFEWVTQGREPREQLRTAPLMISSKAGGRSTRHGQGEPHSPRVCRWWRIQRRAPP